MRNANISEPLLSKDIALPGHAVLVEVMNNCSKEGMIRGNSFVIQQLGSEVPENLLEVGMVCVLDPTLHINPALAKEHVMGISFADQGKRQFAIISTFTWVRMAYHPDEIKYVEPSKIIQPNTEIATIN